MNRVTLCGRLGADPNFKEIEKDGKKIHIANFRLATDDRRTDSTGAIVTHTEWHNAVAFGRNAEIAGTYLKKGRKVLLEGSLRTRTYEDKEKIQRKTTEVLISRIEFVDPAPKAVPEAEPVVDEENVPF